MDFSEAKAHAMELLFDTDRFSRLVTYSPHGGNTYQLPANILYGVSADSSYRGDGHTWRLTVERDSRVDFRHNNGAYRIATVVVRAADISAIPEYRDTIKFDDTTWTITEIYEHA